MTERQQHQFLANVIKESGVRIDTQTSDCWIWEGYTDNEGYGRCQARWANDFETTFAHRISYHLFKEPFLPAKRDKVIMHLCDTPACVNPDHLKLSTQLDNLKDRDVKGRQRTRKGVDCNFSKFTMQDIEIIRTLRMQGKQINEIAKQYKCERHTIADILTGKTYDRINTESFISAKATILIELIDCWIVKLHSQGQTYRKIQETVSRSPSYICNVLKK